MKKRSIEEIEGDYWDEPTFHSYVVVASHKARKKPLFELTAEDVRLLISQQISLDIVLPIAIDTLSTNVGIAAYFYEGDLLNAVLRINDDYWNLYKELYAKVAELINNNIELIRHNTNIDLMRINYFRQVK